MDEAPITEHAVTAGEPPVAETPTPEAAPPTPEEAPSLPTQTAAYPSEAEIAVSDKEKTTPPELLKRPSEGADWLASSRPVPKTPADSGVPEFLARPMANPTAWLQSSMPEKGAREEYGRQQVSLYLNGEIDLTPDQFKQYNTWAEGDTTATGRTVKGIWDIGQGLVAKGRDLIMKPEERAHAADWISTRAKELVEPWRETRDYLKQGNYADAAKSYATALSVTAKNLGVGILGGVDDIVATGAGFSQGAHSVSDELTGVHLIKKWAGIDDNTEKFLTAKIQHETNKSKKDLYESTDTDPENVFAMAGALVPWVAADAATGGIGGLAGAGGRLAEMAPGLLQKGTAMGARVAAPVVREGIGKGVPIVGGASLISAGHPVAGAAMIADAFIPRFALRRGGVFGLPNRLLNAMADWPADKLENLAKTLSVPSRDGEHLTQTLQRGFNQAGDAVADQVKGLMAKEESAELARWLTPDGRLKILPTDLPPEAGEALKATIPKSIQNIANLTEQANKLYSKAAFIDRFTTLNKLGSSALRLGVGTGASVGEAALLGGAMGGAGAAPGDTAAIQEGANGLAMLAIPFSPLTAATGIRAARLAETARYTMNAGKGHVHGDMAGVPQQFQDQMYKFAGMMRPMDKDIHVDTPDVMRKDLGLSASQTPGFGYVDENGHMHVNSTKIDKGVAGHEFTHGTQQLFGEMLRKLNPEQMANFEKLYGTQLAKTRPPSYEWDNARMEDVQGRVQDYIEHDGMGEEEALMKVTEEERAKEESAFDPQAERDAEVGRFVLENTPIEMFYGGERGGDILKRWFGSLLGEGPIRTVPRGFEAPVTRGDVREMKQRFFKVGEMAAGIGGREAPVAGGAVPPVEPLAGVKIPKEVTRVVKAQHFDKIIHEDFLKQAVKGLGPNAVPADVLIEALRLSKGGTPAVAKPPPVPPELRGGPQGIMQQLMPEAAPQTEEFKRWSGAAPVILDAGPRQPSVQEMAGKLQVIGDDLNGYTVVDQSGKLVFGGVSPKLSLIQASDAKARLAWNMTQEEMSKAQTEKFQTGQPVVVGAYHGSPSEKFHVFDPEKLGAYTGAPSAKEGFFFSGNPETAKAYQQSTVFPYRGAKKMTQLQRDELWRAMEKRVEEKHGKYPDVPLIHDFIKNNPQIVKRAAEEITGGVFDMTHSESTMHEVYVKMQNPFVYDFKGSPYREDSYYNLLSKAKAAGHDGAIFTNTYDGGGKPDNIFVAFRNRNIKSTENIGTFDPNTADIRYMPNPHPEAIGDTAIRTPDGKVWTGKWQAGQAGLTKEEMEGAKIGALHPEIDRTLQENGEYTDAQLNNATDGYVSNKGEFLTRRQAYFRAKQLKQLDMSAYNAGMAKYQRDPTAMDSIAFDESARFMPASVEDFQKLAKDAGYEYQGDLDGVLFWKNPDTGKEITAEPWRGRANAIADFKDKLSGKYVPGQDIYNTSKAQAYGPQGERSRLKREGEEGGRFMPEAYIGDVDVSGNARGERYYGGKLGPTHESAGYDDLAWKYNPDTKKVYWWNTPDAEAKSGVENFLSKKGAAVDGHTVMSMEAGHKAFQKSYGESHMMPEVNIGMHVGGEEKLTMKDMADALQATGVKILKASEQRKEGLEPTGVFTLSRALTPKEGHAVSVALGQESIAQHQVGGQGNLFGPQAKKWGPFNPDYFVGHDGRPLTDTLKDYYASHPKRTGASGIWDRMTVDPNFKSGQFADIAEQLGADPKKRFFEQKPAVQKAITDYFMGTGEAQFMPSTHPDAIKEPAWKMEDGKVISAPVGYHSLIPLPKEYKSAVDRQHLEAGFVTNSGEFLDRVQALERAKERDQLAPWAKDPRGWAESNIDEALHAPDVKEGSTSVPWQYMPEVPSDKQLKDALSEDKAAKIGAHRDLPKGTPVSLRIDIPAYNKTGDYAVTVHDRNIGKVHGYDGIATVDNPTFYVQEKGAQKVKEGMAKYPMAAVNGEFNPSRAFPKDINDYSPVGFNPVKHSYFYEKGTRKPVIAGDQAISAGNTVYVKNPVYGNPAGFLYMPEMATAIDRAALRNKETGEIITGGQNDTHFMIPATSGKADDYLGPNGHKIYEEGFVSNAGYWYDREQAHTQMKALGQLPPNYQGEYLDELNVTDLRKGRQTQMMPETKEGYIGHIEDDGNIEGEKFFKGQGGDHEERGYHGLQWRYNNDTQKAYWWSQPTAEEKTALSDWLDKRGKKLEGNVVISEQPHGKTWSSGLYAKAVDEAHLFMPATPEAAHAQTAAEAAQHPEAKPLRWKLDESGQPAMIYDKKTKKTTAKPIEEGYNLAKQYLAEQAAEGKSKTEAHAAKINIAKDKLKEFYDVAKANPEAMQAKGWYRELKEKLLDKLGGNEQDLILFTRLLATTSPNTNPGVNFGFALDAWNRFQKGEYKDVIDKYNNALVKYHTGKLEHANGKPVEGLKQFAGYLYGNDIIPYASGYHEKGPQKGDPKKLGMHSLRVLDTISDHYDRINGLKINQFAHNLAQTDLKSTIDLWAARTLHRLLNEGNANPWRILPMNEKGISEADFHFAQEAFGKAAKELKVSPDDLQAILWFAEKIHYDKQGWSTYLDKGDFRPLVERMEPDVAPKTFKLRNVAPPQ